MSSNVFFFPEPKHIQALYSHMEETACSLPTCKISIHCVNRSLQPHPGVFIFSLMPRLSNPHAALHASPEPFLHYLHITTLLQTWKAARYKKADICVCTQTGASPDEAWVGAILSATELLLF